MAQTKMGSSIVNKANEIHIAVAVLKQVSRMAGYPDDKIYAAGDFVVVEHDGFGVAFTTDAAHITTADSYKSFVNPSMYI